MARFEIKSKDGLSVRFSGKPVYNGSYLKPSSLTFSEVNSPTPIAWEVGDYVDYTRTGMRYYLYSIPQPTKRAKMGSRGDAFSYSGVQFFAATKELEIALFKDLVNSDNNIHFSTSPDVATFENVEGVARRIQSCMDYFFPNRWEIRIADFDAVEDADIIEKINTAKDFALSNGTCLDALSRIYELWQDIGWIHTNENGKEVIIIGYPNKRISENTTDAFVYGKGNGLTAIKKNQTNKDEFATRLYVYGSERNLPARYYNDKDILNAESVDIRNLMLPLDKWGLTDGKPDARKAYLENAEAVAKYGLIPKTHYFDSEEAGADIYPTISGMTIGTIREALTALGQTDSDYFPSTELYPDASQRVDKVRWCDNPDDLGDVGDVLLNGSPSVFDGETKSVDVSSGTRTANIVENKLMASAEFSYSESRTCKARFSTAVSGYVNDDGFESVVVKMRLSDSNNANSSMSKAVEYPALLNGGKWEFTLPSMEYDYGQIPKAIFGAYAFLTIAVTLPSGSKDKSISYVLNTGIQHLDLYLIMEKTFLLRLHEIGFDIDKQASLGKGKVISMKTGACAGRSFVIESCRHKGGIYTQGYWDLTLKRQKDNTLGLMFPNINAQIAEGDEFVLTDIAMPELYVQAAMLRLLSDGQKLLARASSIQNLYEPSIDAKVMVEQGRTLREGMFMEISDADVVDNTTEYILIDTLSIHEDESAIPTYKVTLKERRKVTYKGTPSATSTDNTESVEDDVQTEVNIDLSEYAKKAEVEEVFELLSSMWQLEGDTIVATKDVRIKANLIVEQDTSSGGEGQDTPGAGLDEGEVLDIVKGYTYSKSEINKLIDDVNAGDVDLTNYYTKQEVDAKIPSLDGYAKEGYVDDAITALNVGQYAKASDLSSLQGEVDNIESVLGMDEEAEGIINTWNEVKAFLGSIEVDDDLASILERMNADIATKALDSDLDTLAGRVGVNELAIADNAGNIKKNFDAIGVLESNKADKATTLAGYGITDAYTKSDLESYKTWWDAVMGLVVKDGNNIRIKTNLIVEGDTSSGGSGQDTPASGTVTGIKVSASETLTPNNAGIIDMVSVLASIDVSDQLANYLPLSGGAISGATSSPLKIGTSSSTIGIPLSVSNSEKAWFGWSAGQGAYLWNATANKYLGIKEDGTPHYNGNTLYHTGNFNPANYLPLSGGEVKGTYPYQQHVLTLDTDNVYYTILRFKSAGVTKGRLQWADDANHFKGFGLTNDTTGDRLGLSDSGTPFYNGNTILHSGNYSSYALPKSGGTISGSGYWSLKVKSTEQNAVGIGFEGADGRNGYLLYTGGSDYKVTDNGWNNLYTLIHSGNIGEQRAQRAKYLDTLNAAGSNWYDNQYVVYGQWGSDDILDWKVDNYEVRVDRAKKLQTARTIWGQSFDGTGNVIGALKTPSGYNAVTILDSYLVLGQGMAENSKPTYLDGYNVYMRYGKSSTIGFTLNSSGNVTIGGSDLAGTSWKAYINGSTRIANITLTSSVLNANRNVNTGALLDSSKMGFEIEPFASYITIKGYNTSGTGVGGINIASSGNILVGATADNGQKLQVNGNARFYDNVIIGASNTENGRLRIVGKSGDTNVLVVANYDGISQFKVQNNGAVTMSGSLSVGGNSYVSGMSMIYQSDNAYRLTSFTSENYARIYNIKEDGSSYGSMYIGQNSTGAIVILNGSYVGIGITPSGNYKFQVSGNSYLGGSLHVSTTIKAVTSVTTPLLKSEGGLDIVSNNSAAGSRLFLTTNCFRPWGDDAGLIDLGASNVQWRNVYAVNAIFSGDTSSGSDIRFKDIIKNKTLKIEHIAKAPLFTFKWNDREDDTIHLGSSAQYWEKVCPWLVKGEDFKTLDYSTLGVAMGISLAKKAVNHEERIKALEKENKALKEEIRRMQYGS